MTGNLVRDHIKNPSEGGPGTGVVLIDGLEVQMVDDCYTVEVELAEVEVEITNELTVEIEFLKYDVEVC